MCQFFSLVSDGKGKIYYFDWELRKEVLAGKLKYQSDSHTSIANYFGFKGPKEDTLNKYEYNPLTRKFQIDQLNTTDDSAVVKKQCEALNFKKIIPQLIVKPIVRPFIDRKCEKVTKNDIKLLKQWASVRASLCDSVRDSVGNSVWASVRDSVGDSVWDSIIASARNSVTASVRDSVGNSVWTPIWASVRDSVWASIGAYASSFFNVKGKYEFSSCIKLWNKGLVPSFNGEVWQLYGHKGKIVYDNDY